MFAGFVFVVFGKHNGQKVDLGHYRSKDAAHDYIRQLIADDRANGLENTGSDYSVWHTTADMLA